MATTNAVSMYVRTNPPAIAGGVAGLTAGIIGSLLTSAAALSRTRRVPRMMAATAVAGATGVLVGRVTQRWTWSDERVRDEMIDAELVLGD